MSSNVLIGIWSSGLWQNIGTPSSISALTISGYAVQPNTLGTLGSRINVSYSGVGTGAAYYDASPDLTVDELALIEGLFLISWYNQLAYSNMGAGGTSIPWTRLREGDESIERVNAVNLGAQYREMSKETRLQLDYLFNAYLDGKRGSARSVDFLNPAYPYAGNYNPSNQRSVLGPG